MKKLLQSLALLTALAGLTACKPTEKKEATKTQLDTSIIKQDTTPAHQDIRLKFNDIKVANAAENFVGGTNLATLKEMFGEPAEHQSVPAGEVTLEQYIWKFDQVSVSIHLFQDSTIVRSISNFRFNREEIVSKSDVDALKITNGEQTGDTFKAISDKFGQPDVMSQANSSDIEEIRAIWSSGLKTEKGATLILTFKNNHLTNVEQTGISD
ncbi:DUF3862 domain-containing protein [Streptococcus plurextorum]|uniref:DUF3862 domain-containing protein n=1 Tax=Streptococcus plurextorum TaxID=456876 RepID=UPI0004897671|nr:DUF3862 domain-containing protein [Streptococcus plurextorum]